MKPLLIFMFGAIILAIACAPKTPKNDKTNETELSSLEDSLVYQKEVLETSTTDPIIGERIDGPANIRDGINGKVLFSLNDDVLVTCTALEKEWFQIGILMDIDSLEYGLKLIKAGRKITVDGKEVGEIKSDIPVSSNMNYSNTWVELIGYTHQNNIQSETIIENALVEYLSMHDKTKKGMEEFIHQFSLANTEGFEGLSVYYNYENWIDDPSPMYRIGLVFQGNQLISILHARPLTLPNFKNHKLARAFDILTFDNLSNEDEVVNVFNEFVQSVD